MEILQLLNAHDWYYMMSDDPRAFDRGREEERKIRDEIKQYTPEQILPLIKEDWVRELTEKRFFVGE